MGGGWGPGGMLFGVMVGESRGVRLQIKELKQNNETKIA